MEWNGMEWNGMEWNGMEWNGKRKTMNTLERNIWSALSKERNPRNLIQHLKIPSTMPPKPEYNTKQMAQLARDYHEKIQHEENLGRERGERHENNLCIQLEDILRVQNLCAQYRNHIWEIKDVVLQLIKLAKNGSATSMDGCPYELWKTLVGIHDKAQRLTQKSFDMLNAPTRVFQDIQKYVVNEHSNFSFGWMRPIFKKKDPTDTCNYCPITLPNTDYKILTKVLALQLIKHIDKMVHVNQTGFMPKRSIFDHI